MRESGGFEFARRAWIAPVRISRQNEFDAAHDDVAASLCGESGNGDCFQSARRLFSVAVFFRQPYGERDALFGADAAYRHVELNDTSRRLENEIAEIEICGVLTSCDFQGDGDGTGLGFDGLTAVDVHFGRGKRNVILFVIAVDDGFIYRF